MLKAIVGDMITKYGGGEPFFTNLDREVQKKEILNDLLNLIPLSECVGDVGIIVTGKFGDFVKRECKALKIYTVGGGLRSGSKIEGFEVKHKKYIMLDDSYYSGRTRNVIKNHLLENGAELGNVYVVYDGSKQREQGINSLFRYHN